MLSCPADMRPLGSTSYESLMRAASRIRRHDAASRTPPSLCANLAPAGTGTMSLRDRLWELSVAASPHHNPNSTLLHHRHDIFLRDAESRGARCVVLTLRDPAERLLSAFLFDMVWGGTSGHSIFHLYSKRRGTPSPNAMVWALNRSDERAPKNLHCRDGPCTLRRWLLRTLEGSRTPNTRFIYDRLANRTNKNGVTFANAPYATTVAASTCMGSADHAVPPSAPSAPPPTSPPDAAVAPVGPFPSAGTPTASAKGSQALILTTAANSPVYGPAPSMMCRGSPFLIPQADYLEGLDKVVGDDQGSDPALEVHVVCTHRFEADWARLVEAFGMTNRTIRGKNRDWRAKTSAHSNHSRHSANSVKNSSAFFSDDARDFVRRCLYPQDMQLFELLCKP